MDLPNPAVVRRVLPLQVLMQKPLLGETLLQILPDLAVQAHAD